MIFRQPPQTEPTLELKQSDLREAQRLGAEQDDQIRKLESHSVFRSAVATPEEYGRVKNELELLQLQRTQTLARQREIQAAIDSILSAEHDRQQLELARTEEAEAAKQVLQASTLCNELDAEFRSWQLRKDQALHGFYESLKRHNAAKERVAGVSKTADVRQLVVSMA